MKQKTFFIIFEGLSIKQITIFLGRRESDFKDTLPIKLCSGVVYSFKCNSYNAIYYGKTKRRFYVRAAKHMAISYLSYKPVTNVKLSAIYL